MISLVDLRSRPWAMERRAFRAAMEHLARADVSKPESFFFLLPAAEEQASDLDVRDGVAVVRVRGALVREPYYASSRSREWSYTGIRERISEALGRGDVKSIVLDIDSPGGEALGLSEISDFIHAARSEKTIDAVIRGVGASAAYFIASSAENVFLAREGIAGSIGTIMLVTDWSKYDERIGLQEIHIVSTQSPKKDPDATTDEGRAQLQAEVDAIADVFVRSVARNRGVSTDRVLAEFGQGDVLVGAAAVSAGLVDGIATLDDVIAARAAGEPVKFLRPL